MVCVHHLHITLPNVSPLVLGSLRVVTAGDAALLHPLPAGPVPPGADVRARLAGKSAPRPPADRAQTQHLAAHGLPRRTGD